MKADDIVENLVYLSKYLEESRGRVDELEKELETVRRGSLKAVGSPSMSGRIFQLEADKAALRRELWSLQDKIKAKKEQRDVKEENGDVKIETDANLGVGSVPSVPNTVLADTRDKLNKERRVKEALQAKCAALEGQLKETAEVASKTMREQVEVEKILAKIRRESEALKQRNADLQESNEAADANTAALASLREKYERLKEQKTGWRESSEELGSQIGALKEKLSRVKAQHQAVKAEKEKIQETLREMIELVESLQEDVRANSDLVHMADELSNRLKASEAASSELYERCISLECIIAQLTEKTVGASEVAEQAMYREYVKSLPYPENPPSTPISMLQPVCYIKTNLHAYLSQDPNAKSFLNHMLYRPKRVVTMGFHFLAFGPTHRYDRATEQWTEGSDLSSFHGGTRELFVNCKDFVVYAGSYKCLDLSELKPMGTALPSQISPGEILDAALGVPRPKNYVKIIKKQFPDGAIKVGATALQYVGFNQTLYDALRRRFASDRATKGKRKASGEDLRDGGKLKVQKKF